MQPKKRFMIKLIAFGFAIAAMAAPTAEARPDPGDGVAVATIVRPADHPRSVRRASRPQAVFEFGAWYRRHWRNIPE